MMSKRTDQRSVADAIEGVRGLVDSDDLNGLNSLIASGLDVNASNVYGTTPLMIAAKSGRLGMVRELLRNGADPNRMRNDQFTALALAAFFGHEEIVKILVEHGSRIDVATRVQTSPQMWATARTFQGVASYLSEQSSAPFRQVKNASAIRKVHVPNKTTNAKLLVTKRSNVFAITVVLIIVATVLLSFSWRRFTAVSRTAMQSPAPSVAPATLSAAERAVIEPTKEVPKPSTPSSFNLNHYKSPESRRSYRPSLSRNETIHNQNSSTVERVMNIPSPSKIPEQETPISKRPPISATPSASRKTVQPISPLLMSPKNPTSKSRVIQWP